MEKHQSCSVPEKWAARPLLTRLSLDSAAFYNVYDDLATFEPGTPFLTPVFVPTPTLHLSIPIKYENKSHGETQGVEGASTFIPTEMESVLPFSTRQV